MAVRSEQSASSGSTFDIAVVRVQEDRVSIRASGRLNQPARDFLAAVLSAELAVGHVFVRMELSDVTSLDGSCLATLKDVHEGCLASQGVLLLEGLCGEARHVLAAAALDRCLFVTGTRGPSDWLPNIDALAALVRHECSH